MPTFIELSPDPFNQQFDHLSEEARFDGISRQRGNKSGVFDHVRRPVRGLQLKADTYATLQVIGADGSNVRLIDSGAASEEDETDGPSMGRSSKYSNFLLQSVQEARQEKTQIVETFGEAFIFFFGEHPRTIQMSGMLVNSEDFNWRAEWWENYDKYLRGTKCAETRTRVVMSWDDIVVMGYMMNCSASEDSSAPMQVPFNFTLFLTHYMNVSRIGSTDFPTAGEALNLDPNKLDVEGLSDGFVSTTRAVRRANSSGVSLLESIRRGLNDFLTEQASILKNGIDQAGSFMMGRVIHIPAGYEAMGIYDDIQSNAAAFDPSMIGTPGSVVDFNKVGNRIFTVKVAARGPTTKGMHYGKIYENSDEFIARLAKTSSQPVKASGLDNSQLTPNSLLPSKVTQVMLAYGIDTTPPSALIAAAAKVSFFLTTKLIGDALLKTNASSKVNEAGVQLAEKMTNRTKEETWKGE